MRPRLLALAALGLLAAADPPTLAHCAAIADAAERLACYDRVAGRAATTAPTPADAAPAAAAADPVAEFGRPPAPAKTEIRRIEARIVGAFNEWKQGTLVRLDNGQVWKVAAQERGYYPSVPPNAEVVIEKGFLGGYWLEITAVSRRIKVRRVS